MYILCPKGTYGLKCCVNTENYLQKVQYRKGEKESLNSEETR